jgi:hypothetical protein
MDDSRAFNKEDMQKNTTAEKLRDVTPLLERTYYPPCKAKTYLRDITERRAITILKQVLRKHCMTLLSRERNIRGKKMIYYQLIPLSAVHKLYRMTKNGDDHACSWVSFDR